MPKLTLFFAPGACSRVPLIALEEIGVPFDTRLVTFTKGEHRSREYLALNPKGKVPTLMIDGQPLTENVAILSYLAWAYPGATLLPFGRDPLSDMQILSQLAWCAAGLHPIVTRLRIPQFFCDTADGRERVWQMAADAMAFNFALIEARLAESPWMLGDWSILDAYVNWVWFRVTGAGFDATAYPRYGEHAARIAERPSVRRALAREEEAQAWLESRGLAVKFGQLQAAPAAKS